MADFEATLQASLDIKQAKQDFESFKKSTESQTIKIKLDTDFVGNNSDFTKYFTGIEKQAQNAGKNIGKSYNTAIQNQIESMARTQRNAFSEPLNNITKQQQSYIDWWEKSLSRQSKTFNQLDATTASNKTLSWLKNNSKAAKDYENVLTDLANKQRLATSNEELKNYTKQVNSIKAEAASLGKTGKSFTEELGRGFKQIAQFAGTYGVIQRIPEEINRMYQEVVKVDTAMTNLYKVTEETSKVYSDFQNSAGTDAKELGRDISSYIEQTANWAKLGYSLKDAKELSRISSIYANVGEVDDATAVSDIVTAMKSFNIEASDSITIIDQLNKLGNEFATSSADLGEGLTKSASAMKTAGTDLNHTLAMLTGGAEITQNAGEFGNFLKVASMRIRGMKGELEDLGEEVDDSIESISKVQTQILNLTHGQVNIFNSNGEFRDYYEIMEQISAIHDKLSSTEQASLDEILFGKQRANQGAALIQAFQSGQIQKALTATYNSTGSAMKEQERWMDSLEAKTNQLKAAFQQLSTTTLNSNFLKGLVDGATEAVTALDWLIDKISVLGTLSASAGIFALIKNFGSSNEFALYGCESIVA